MGRYIFRRKIIIFLFFCFCIPLYAASFNQIQENSQIIPLSQLLLVAKQDGLKKVVYKTPDLSGTDKKEVDYYRKRYLTSYGKKHLQEILNNAGPYRLYIRKKLKEKNMPLTLEYLPFIESEYNPKAKSKSGAAGLWQFMKNSTKPFLRCDQWVDERFDPWKSTDAALRKLQDNYNMFGDWNLAIAAYNCGAGKLKKVLRSSKNKSYWYLVKTKKIARESAEYIPKLIAIADIAENPEYYDININSFTDLSGKNLYLREGEFDYITVNHSISLAKLAVKMRLDSTYFLQINSALIYGITPPDTPYKIRLPEGCLTTAKIILNNKSQLYKSLNNNKYTIYYINKGDTLYSIAKKINISIEELCKINDITDKKDITLGKILYIPKNKPIN